jgi:hypothetical protein
MNISTIFDYELENGEEVEIHAQGVTYKDEDFNGKFSRFIELDSIEVYTENKISMDEMEMIKKRALIKLENSL